MKLHYLFFSVCIFSALLGFAQPSLPSLAESYDFGNAPVALLPKPNVEQALQADKARGNNSRVGLPIAVDLDLETAGEWTRLPDGGHLWAITIKSPDALGLALMYEQLYLPPGAALYMFAEPERALGPFQFKDNRPNGRFLTGFTEGESTVLAYYEPAAQAGRGQLRINRADYAYQSLSSSANFGFGTSWDCHPNANCPDGMGFRDEQRSVCRILMVLEEGTGFCTGTLMNNTAEDEKPYILSAFHCDVGFTPIHDMWRFDFAYEAAGCNNPNQEPLYQSVMGCSLRAGRLETDFVLLEASTAVPPSFNAYYSGWSREEAPPKNGLIFHHASGDIKKLSRYESQTSIQPTSIIWTTGNTPPNHHYRVDYSLGTFQQGSSGSALLDSMGRVRGQLHGGFNDCDGITTAYFGRFSLSWDAGDADNKRLVDWLDPLGLDPESLDGKDAAGSGTVSIGGQMLTETGLPINNAVVMLSGPVSDTVITGPDGLYTFFDVPLGEVIGLKATKDDTPQEGLSNLDLILIGQHNLGVALLDSPYKRLAADANGSNSISVLDQIVIRKVILGISLGFEAKDDWQFVPVAWPFANAPNPFNPPLPEVFLINNITGNITDLDFVGFRVGDVNNSADPSN